MNKYKCKSNYKKVGRFNLHVNTGSWIRFKICLYSVYKKQVPNIMSQVWNKGMKILLLD